MPHYWNSAEMTNPDPARVVADADVLAADLFVDGHARAALDMVRSHSWLTLVATPALLDETEHLIDTLADTALAKAWRRNIDEQVTMVTPMVGGHPALVAAGAGKAATLLSLDPHLQSATAGATIRPNIATSIKSPKAFVTMTDPASLYEAVVGGDYPGPDRDPRG